MNNFYTSIYRKYIGRYFLWFKNYIVRMTGDAHTGGGGGGCSRRSPKFSPGLEFPSNRSLDPFQNAAPVFSKSFKNIL